MIKTHYNQDTGFILGYYPDSISYKTIPKPYIEITEEEHRNSLDKEMVVVDGVFQEYIKPDEVLLQEAKIAKKADLKALRDKEKLKCHKRKATELTRNIEDGSFTSTGVEVDFYFDVQLGELPSGQDILNDAVQFNVVIQYACDIYVDESTTREGWIELTPAIATSILVHIKERLITAIHHYRDLKVAIQAATTLEEVNNINWGL